MYYFRYFIPNVAFVPFACELKVFCILLVSYEIIGHPVLLRPTYFVRCIYLVVKLLIFIDMPKYFLILLYRILVFQSFFITVLNLLRFANHVSFSIRLILFVGFLSLDCILFLS